MQIHDRIIEIFADRGGDAYFGEPVTQLEHALQAAWLAEKEDAPPWLVVAALLHDIGHLLRDPGSSSAHEDAGQAWLAQYFGPEVTAPVLLHVAAKRYLCATDPKYLSLLSTASLDSLKFQGGPFSAAETRAFEQKPFFREAVRLRYWDDLAKLPGLAVPGLAHYRAKIEASLEN